MNDQSGRIFGKNILAGMIGSAIIAFLIFVGSRILSYLPIFSEKYINYIIMMAAKGHQYRAINAVYFIIVYIIIYGIVFIILSIIYEHRRLKNEFASLLSDEKHEVSDESTLKATIARSKKRLKLMGRVSIPIAIIVAICFIFTLVLSYVSVEITYKTVITFKQRFTIIEQFISDQEEEDILAKWALMKDKNEYISVNKMLDAIANENNITLPEPNIKY